MKGNTLKILLSILLIAIIALSSFIVLSNNQVNKLQNQNNTLETQVSDLQTQNGNLKTQINDLQNQINTTQNHNNQLQIQVSALQAEKTELENQTTTLQNQIDELQTQLSQFQKNYSVAISNFHHSSLGSYVFGASVSSFNFTIQNTGNTVLKDLVLEVNLTLSDGETSHFTTKISELGVNETQQISGNTWIYNVIVNLYGLQEKWSISVTALNFESTINY